MNTVDSGWHQLLSGMVVGLVSIATVLASVLLASQESGGPAPTSIAMATPSAVTTHPPTIILTAFFTPGIASPTTAGSPAAPVSTPTPEVTAAPVPTMACPVPLGWSAYIVRLGDSVTSIARATATSIYDIIQGNCLADTDVTPGQVLYLPPYPTRGPTATRVPCGPPINWVVYRVQPRDTLYGLAIRHGTSVSALARANCMEGYSLRAGQWLYVPPEVVVSPTATPTRVPSATPSLTPTRAPSFTPSATWPSPSATVTGIAPSHTPTATASIVPTTASPTGSPSSMPPSATPTVTNTPQSPTPTVAPSVTPTHTPRPSATPSATSLPSATPTLTSPSPTGPSSPLAP